MRPILEPHYQYLRPDATIRSLKAVRVKYLPEISCIVRYEADIGEERPLSIYGKVQHSRRGAFTYDVMKALWDLPARASGEMLLSRSGEHTSELQSPCNLVCRLLLVKK